MITAVTHTHSGKPVFHVLLGNPPHHLLQDWPVSKRVLYRYQTVILLLSVGLTVEVLVQVFDFRQVSHHQLCPDILLLLRLLLVL